MATIVARRRGTETYYYYHVAQRVKVSPSDQGGKGRGSGPSKVVTKDIYLGSADTILRRLQDGPLEVRHRSFGVEMAALSVIREIGLIEAIDSVVTKRNQGMSIGNYIALGILGKLASPNASWHTFADWLSHTALPDHYNLPHNLLDGQNFWDAFDKILPESVFRKRVAQNPEALMDDEMVLRIEEAVWKQILERYKISINTILYDSTNFFTFIAPENPAQLPKNGHNKAGRHERRQVSLALAMLRDYGLPLLHITYAGNVNDPTLFPDFLTRLVRRVAAVAKEAEHLLLVFDRGQNSKTNIQKVRSLKVHAVGGLSWKQHKDLLDIPLECFRNANDPNLILWEQERIVWELPVKVVITFNPALERKHRRTLARLLRILRARLKETYAKHRQDPPEVLAEALEKVSSRSRACRYVRWWVDRKKDRLHIRPSADLEFQVKQCGKRLLFSTDTQKTGNQIIRLYNKDKAQLEQGFHHLKSPDLIRFQPLRVWTDTKIRIYALICVLALLVLRIMEMKAMPVGLSTEAMFTELADIREVIMVYSPHQAQRKVTALSSIQQKLFHIFGLDAFAKTATGSGLGLLPLHH
ncbi:MAG: IS1634 family transposase [Candidatus Methanomethyliaceae archaeon]